jgi:biotin carboxyl carrier protein
MPSSIMRRVVVNGREWNLRMERRGDEIIFESEHGSGSASIIETEPGIYSVLLDRYSFEARICEGGIEIDGERYAAEAIDPRSMAATQSYSGAEGRQAISAPMPGKVVRVLVSEGDLVEAGQGVVVVEAMKMQNELKAPKTGRVASLPVREGVAVNGGDVLAIVE